MTKPACRIAQNLVMIRRSPIVRRLKSRMARSATWTVCLLVLSAAPASADPAVNVRTVDGHEQSGTLTGIDASGLVLDSGGVTQHLALPDLIELHFDASDRDSAVVESRLILTTGDRISVDVVRLQDDSLVCRWRPFEDDREFRVPLESLLGVVLHPDPDARAQRALERQLQQRALKTDVVYLTNGDRLAGVFEELNQNSCRCETTAGSFEVNRSRVRAVGFNAALLAPVAKGESSFVLHLEDGSWLTCHSADWQGGADLRAVTVVGVDVPVPVDRVRRMSFYGPRVTALSEIEPLEIVMTPFLTRETPTHRDRNACGGALTVHGEAFARGLGMCSRTTATYPLGGAYASFQTVVGIDDAAEEAGSVHFKVSVDGQLAFESGLVTARDAPLSIGPIDLRDAESITLTVDYGTWGDIGDLADWCNPVLIR